VRVDNLAMDSYTHVIFPGSRPQRRASEQTVGEYPLESFVGPAVVVDVADLAAGLDPFFDAEGRLALAPRDEGAGLAFLHALDGLEVTRDELAARLARTGAGSEVRGVLLHSGLARHWTYQKLQVWEHRYFFNPYLAPEACRDLAAAGIAFVGIDSLQIDSPWLNLSGQEIPFVLHPRCRRLIAERRAAALGDPLVKRHLRDRVEGLERAGRRAADGVGEIDDPPAVGPFRAVAHSA
jgi:kynurenine formamidase